jgi:hypothetical protein
MASPGRPRTTDPEELDRRSRARAYVRFVCQARFRKEENNLTLEQFNTLWADPKMWAKRGRAIDCPTMTRIDYEKPWSLDNIIIVDRLEQLRIARERAIGNGSVYGRRKKIRKYQQY